MNRNSNLAYSQDGDYLVPNLTLGKEEKRSIGKWGQLRKEYLREHRNGKYSELLLSGKLDKHIADIDEQANARMQLIQRKMLKKEPIPADATFTEAAALRKKAQDAAEEIVFKELIYG